MISSEFFIREIPCRDETEIFQKLYDDNTIGRDISPFQIKHLLKGDNHNAYAVFEKNYQLIPVQFVIGDETIIFENEEKYTLMSIEELQLLRALESVALDGVQYHIQRVTYNLVDEPVGCQRIIVISLKEDKQ